MGETVNQWVRTLELWEGIELVERWVWLDVCGERWPLAWCVGMNRKEGG